MKIVVLGGGMIGSAMASDLCGDYDVTCCDLNPEVLKALQSKWPVKTRACDFSSDADVRKVIEGFDLVVGAVPGFLGFQVLKTIIDAGKNCVDISFFPENAFLLDEAAKKKNVTVVVDCGVAPGMCNIIAGYHSTRMKISSYECLVGGLPVVRSWPFEYKAPFSPADVIEEYTRPARYVENGSTVVKEALSDCELIDFDGVGSLEAFNTDGLRSLALTMPEVPNMKEKTLRYPGHAALMKTFRESGFFSQEKIKIGNADVSPLELLSKILFRKWKYESGEEDFTVMRVIVEGTDEKGPVRHTWSLHDRYDRTTGMMSMARTTGFTATAAIRLVLERKFTRTGICPPEYLGMEPACFDFIVKYLEERNVRYARVESRG